MKKKEFKYFAPATFKAISILDNGCGDHLTVLVQNHHVNADDPFCWSVYNEESNVFSLHIDYDTAKRVFLKKCEDLLTDYTPSKGNNQIEIKPDTTILPW
jgi:hypothetical protein